MQYIKTLNERDMRGIASYFLLFFVICLLPSTSMATSVTAADLSTQTCNATYYESLKSRAWLEGQRRTRQAQNYILKPDSILDYSCFGILNNISALETEQIFSEQHAGHCFPDSLDCSLDRLVISALNPYLFNNFGHTFLGGRSSLSRAAYDPDNTTICSVMTDVWTLAKCRNFAQAPDQDGFLSFEQYVTNDPRIYPAVCTNPPNVGSQWTSNINTAFTPGGGTWHQEVLDSSTTIDTNYTQYLGVGNAPPGCGEFIRTGITTLDYGSIFYTTGQPDGVCTNPACTPDGSGGCELMTF